MGFLDRLVADMVGDATGLPVTLADHDLSAAERAWLGQLAATLGLDAAACEALEIDLRGGV